MWSNLQNTKHLKVPWYNSHFKTNFEFSLYRVDIIKESPNCRILAFGIRLQQTVHIDLSFDVDLL